MLPSATAANVYTDFTGLEALKRQARSDAPEAVQKVAQQFESLFVQMMLKSMRDAGISDGLLKNEQTRFFQDMHDKQLALHLADDTGLGLARLIADQLGDKKTPASSADGKTLDGYRNDPVWLSHGYPARGDAASDGAPGQGPGAEGAPTNETLKNANDRPITTPKEFVERMLPHARQAAEALGVAPGILIAQAALETGWGRSVIKEADGATSHNLFNIKADARWTGDRVTLGAVEFEKGVAVKRRASFRVYRDFQESFADYVRLLKTNPRYQDALNNADDPYAYIEKLQEAGYATDPNYAAKVKRIFDSRRLAAAGPEGDGEQGAARTA